MNRLQSQGQCADPEANATRAVAFACAPSATTRRPPIRQGAGSGGAGQAGCGRGGLPAPRWVPVWRVSRPCQGSPVSSFIPFNPRPSGRLRGQCVYWPSFPLPRSHRQRYFWSTIPTPLTRRESSALATLRLDVVGDGIDKFEPFVSTKKATHRQIRVVHGRIYHQSRPRCW